jgi:hypothetical protein
MKNLTYKFGPVGAMQHIYQPVMIKTLLESNNKASKRKIDPSFLQLDESQIDYYKIITSQMPGRVLKKHNIVSELNLNIKLNRVGLAVCEPKLTQFVDPLCPLLYQFEFVS